MKPKKSRELRVAWDKNMPPEIITVLQPIIDEWLHIVPTWCHFLKISYVVDDIVAAMATEPMYRRAFLMIGGGWITHGRNGRIHSIVHELLHIVMEPTSGTLDKILKEYVTDDAAREVVEHEWRKNYEGVTEDLTNMLAGPRDY